MSDAEREKTMVHELLELKSKVDGIIEKAFKNSQLFQGVVREGFEAVVNRRQNKPAELIGWCGLAKSVLLLLNHTFALHGCCAM